MPLDDYQFRSALHDLLRFSPDRRTLAQRALGWAQALGGGKSAFIVDSDRSILAAQGLDPAEASLIADHIDFPSAAEQKLDPWRLNDLVIVPLDLQKGPGAIVLVSANTTPIFGDDELTRLAQYAVSITAGIDRVTLTSRVQALEKAKSDFLNIASHELRGPMTIIKGYLTMFEGARSASCRQRRPQCSPCSSPSRTRSSGCSSRCSRRRVSKRVASSSTRNAAM